MTTQPQPIAPRTDVPYEPVGDFAGRPTSVTVIASIGLVLGALMLLYKPATLAILAWAY